MKYYAIMSDNKEITGPFWLGLTALDYKYAVKRNGKYVELPSFDTEVKIQNEQGLFISTTAGEILNNAVRYGIIDIVDENKKKDNDSLNEYANKIKAKQEEIANKKRIDKFIEVLKLNEKDFIKYIESMVDRFSADPSLCLANLKQFKKLENKSNKTRKSFIKYLNEQIKIFEITDDTSKIKDPKTGKEVDDIIKVKV